MITTQPLPITANIQARLQLLPILQSLVESGCTLFGMNRSQTLKLVMAGEELFAYVCSVQPLGSLQITLSSRATGAALELCFSRLNIDLSGMNFTASDTISVDEQSGNLDNLGLLLASRMVDGFSLTQKEDMVSVVLQQDSEYPKGTATRTAPGQVRGDISIASKHDPATIIDSCQRARAFYHPMFLPDSFDTPGKIADMVMFDEIFIVRAVDLKGQTCGILYWKYLSDKCVGFCGPYIFVEQTETTARLLMQKMLDDVARTAAKIIISTLATNDLPAEFMEPLAHVTYLGKEGETDVHHLWYRQLAEDNGSIVWSHPDLIPFLQTTYENLELCRDIHTVSSLGEKQHAHSILSVDLKKNQNRALIIPMIDGADIQKNIHTHVQNLLIEGIQNIFFHLDLALAWQAHIEKDLMQNGFEPAYLLPQAGSSDILVFHYVPSMI